MGFDAVWISPVTDNIPENTAYGEAYHGYWARDMWRLNSHFGTADDLKALSTALHSAGMYLMVDVVANHVGSGQTNTQVNYAQYGQLGSSDYFHTFCWISDYSNQTNVEQCWLGDSNVPLPDINTEKTEVVTLLNSWISNLVSTYLIDGLRIDTVKHVRKDFWSGFQSAAGVFAIGEVYSGDPSYVGPYQSYLDSLLGYPLYYPLVAAFQSSSGTTQTLVDMVSNVKSDFKDPTVLGSFLENQDNPRFPSYTSDTMLTQNALAFVLLGDGIPIVYYGQEQIFAGGNDPNNREALWTTGFATDSVLYAYITKLNKVRRAATTYSSGSFLTTQMNILQGSGSQDFVFYKPGLLVYLNNRGSSSSSSGGTWYVHNSGFTQGVGLTEVLDCTSYTVGSGGEVDVPLSLGKPRIYVPTSALSGSRVCGL